jgi:tape measure domain-containing protein
MATDVERLIVALEARTSAFEKAMNRASGIATQRARAIESTFARMNSRIGSTMAGIGRGWIAALGAGLSVQAIGRLSDAATRIDNALKVAGLSGAELEKVYGRLRDSAVANAAPLESLVTLYSRAATVQNELGVSSEQLLNFTNNVALALRVAGTDAQSASGALLQLSQALGSGTVRAEEFNSILEGALPIAQAAAAGLEEAGGSVAKLRALVVAGQVSSQAFFAAFEAGSVTLQQKVANSTLTVDQALNNLQTSLIDAAREFNQATGASQSFAQGIDRAARVISDFDVAGFIGKIQAARDELSNFLNEAGNAGIIKDLNEALGVTANGELVNPETDKAQDEIAALEREVKLLQDTIAKNTALGFDNTEAIAQLDAVLGKLAQVRAAAASLPATVSTSAPLTGATGAAPGFVPGTPGDPNALAQHSTAAPAVVKPVSLNDFAPPSGGGGGKKGRGGGGGKRSDLERETEQIQKHTAALQAETAALAGINPLVDDYGFAVEKARAKQELLTAAQEDGVAITPELEAKIDALATGYATASAEAERLAQRNDDIKDAARDFAGLGKDVLGGFIKDLRDGKDASEALADALGKLEDRLLDVGLDALFGGGGGGGLGGLFSTFFAKNGGVYARGRPQPMKTFASGGVSRSAAIFGEAGPEAAVPLPDGRRIPVDLRGPAQASGGQQAVHVTVGVSADNNGNLMPFVESVSQRTVRQAAPGIVGASVKQVQTGLPGMMANAQARAG